MPPFKRLNTKIYHKNGPEITDDNIYWKKLGVPVLVKEFGPIDYIDFSPIEPHYFAVTCSVRVQVYNPITRLVVKNLSRFRENAYGAVFRSDGRLICAGGEESNVRLFDVSTKSLLRLFKGHTAPVHRTHFLHGKPQISSFSDDKSVRLWDIPTEKTIMTYNSHTDYVRAGATCLAVPDMLISGGYDNKVKMYDTRTENEVLTVDHGSPIESLLFLPSGGIFLSAGGTEIKIWDTIAGGKLLGSISQHHKTITCLRLASDNKRLLSGSLDRHVKIYDVATFKTVHTLDFPNSILSLGVSKNDDTVVAGLVDGMVSVSRREEKEVKKPQKKMASYQYVSNTHPVSVDTIVADQTNDIETKYDHHLRKFEFSKALDSVLLPYVATKNPQITVSLMQELIRRKALHKAYKGRDKKSLTQILRFFIRNIADHRFTRVLIDAANIFLDTYEDSISVLPPEVGKLFVDLTQVIKQELEVLDSLASLQGMMSMLLASQVTVDETSEFNKKGHNLLPSADAQKNLVLTIS
nr:U3 small nucleolar RNA-associated protein 15 homolog [Leptinotarsa decemlineata]